jgi:hypothetical protein
MVASGVVPVVSIVLVVPGVFPLFPGVAPVVPMVPGVAVVVVVGSRCGCWWCGYRCGGVGGRVRLPQSSGVGGCRVVGTGLEAIINDIS